MKLISCLIAVALLLGALPASAADKRRVRRAPRQENEQQSPVRTLAAERDALVTLCITSGDVVVRGWDKNEVRVRAEAERVELQATDRAANISSPRFNPPVSPPNVPGLPNVVNAPAAPNAASAPHTPGMASAPGAPNRPGQRSATSPAKGIEVLLGNSEDDELSAGDCGGSGNVELDVPRGATLVLRVMEGDVDVSDVAETRIEAMNGDTNLRHIARAVEVENMSGSIFLNDSSGRVRLRTFSGDVEAVNVRTIDTNDHFFAKTTSGNVTLDRVAHAHVEAGTVSGDVNMIGDLASGGSYDFQTFSGDVTLSLPADVSFKLNAHVASGGKISSDFPVKSTTGAQPLKELPQGRLIGTVGTGGPELHLSSFNGTLRLRKQ